MTSAEARERVHETLGEIMPFDLDDAASGDETPDAGVLTGWVVVAEWQGSDGNRWLSKLPGDATAAKGLPSWQERGFCNEVVSHWPDPE